MASSTIGVGDQRLHRAPRIEEDHRPGRPAGDGPASGLAEGVGPGRRPAGDVARRRDRELQGGLEAGDVRLGARPIGRPVAVAGRVLGQHGAADGGDQERGSERGGRPRAPGAQAAGPYRHSAAGSSS